MLKLGYLDLGPDF